MKTKKIKAYSFECPMCGKLEYGMVYDMIYDNYYCEKCNSVVKITEHEIEVPDLPEVGRIVKIAINDGDVFCAYFYKLENKKVYIKHSMSDHIKEMYLCDINDIKSWCYLKEDK